MPDAGRPPLLKVSDVAELLQVTPAFVYRHARELGAFKVGRHLRFAVNGVEAWLESRRLDEPSWDPDSFPSRPQTVPSGWMSQARGIRGRKRPSGRSDNCGDR
ncbi:MAG: helix-turn-helix domain-containing protein [Actinomycetota bacterium]